MGGWQPVGEDTDRKWQLSRKFCIFTEMTGFMKSHIARVLVCLLAFILGMQAAGAQAALRHGVDDTDCGRWAGKAFARGQVPPFSFTYGGVPSAQLLPRWKFSRQELTPAKETEVLTAYTWTDPKTGLQVEAQVKRFTDWNATEWVLLFRNTGSADTPPLAQIRTVDLYQRSSGAMKSSGGGFLAGGTSPAAASLSRSAARMDVAAAGACPPAPGAPDWQIYFADESPYTEGGARKYQNISLLETFDGGTTWSPAPRIASYTPRRRDGMPAVIDLGEWRYLAIESNPGRTHLHPQLVRTRIADNWRETVGAPSPDRSDPSLEKRRDWTRLYGGAPYIAATENYVLLSWQEHKGRQLLPLDFPIVRIAAARKKELGEGAFPTLFDLSTPPGVAEGKDKMLWNSLCALDGDAFLLVSQCNARVIIWPARLE